MSVSNAGLSLTYTGAHAMHGAGFGQFMKAVNKNVINPIKKKNIISGVLHAAGDATNVFAPGVGSKIGELGDVAKKYGAGKKRK